MHTRSGGARGFSDFNIVEVAGGKHLSFYRNTPDKKESSQPEPSLRWRSQESWSRCHRTGERERNLLLRKAPRIYEYYIPSNRWTIKNLYPVHSLEEVIDTIIKPTYWVYSTGDYTMQVDRRRRAACSLVRWGRPVAEIPQHTASKQPRPSTPRVWYPRNRKNRVLLPVPLCHRHNLGLPSIYKIIVVLRRWTGRHVAETKSSIRSSRRLPSPITP
jgi:hypothetical protein